jgi:Protein of unknown function (DUF3124)
MMDLKPIRAHIGLLWLLICSLAWTAPALAAPPAPSQGQLVYVPVYSHIFFGDRQQSFNLAVTLSLRNTDLTNPIAITSVAYYDEKGKLVKDLAPPALNIAPLAAARFYIKESDVSAGSEACFLVRWQSSQKTSPPIIEGLMVGTSFGQGISFTSSGRVLKEFSGK